MTSYNVYTLLDTDDHGSPVGPPPPPPRLIDRLHQYRHPIALTALAVLIVATASYAAVAIVSNHQSQASIRAAVAATAANRTSLSTTATEVTTATAALQHRQQAELRTTQEIGTAEHMLTTATQANGLQSLDIATLQTCLAGVSRAVTADSAGNTQGAVSSITAASSSCLALDSTSGGLVYPFDFPDPSVLTVGSEYYAFATNSAAGNIQIIQSPDLIHWTTVGDALPHVAAWAQSGATWGPSVMQRGGNYVLYYSALDGTTGDQCISEAVATQPQGPYVDSSRTPLVCQLNLGGSIDPSPFVDTDGTVYLTWKSQGVNGQPPTLWSQQLTRDGTALAPDAPSALLTPSQSWQGGIVEGPDMILSGGQYLLFYSGSNWQTADYAIGVSDCTGPLGPCTPASGQPLLASDASMSGPGGPSVFSDAQGNLWLAFDAWLPGKVGYPNSRPFFLRRISISAGVVTVEPQ